MPRTLRIALLLLVLSAVAALTLGERHWVRSWSRPLQVAIYPIAMDAASKDHISHLLPGDFQPVAAFVGKEGQRWQQAAVLAPRIILKPALDVPPPTATIGGPLDAILLSLRLRWYAFRHTAFWENLGGVRMFLLYHEPRTDQALPHSLGLQKGLLGIVHVFASSAQRDQNNVVITHELLHALGAKDKYDGNGQPMHPAGYADPYEQPLLPQTRAEIMAGRIALTAGEARMPDSLEETVIGYATAAEIGWRQR